MNPTSSRRACLRLFPVLLAAAVLGGGPSPAAAQGRAPIELTDVAGRTVRLSAPAQRVILGEGRLLYGTGIIDRDAPFRRIVGWAEDMIQYDPGTYRAYRARFPEAERLPRFGSSFSGDFSVEQAIALNPDLVIFSLSSLYKLNETGALAQLERAGIPALIIDFREQPTQNTVPSIELLGRAFGEEARAAAFVAFYRRETQRVSERIARRPESQRVHVVMERAAGYDPNQCCMTFGNANLGTILQDAGGINWGSSRFPGLGGTMNPEAVFAEDPEVIIGTGADWAESAPGSRGVPFGYEATPQAVQAALAALAQRRGWPSLRAVRERRFYSIYHQFYTSPAHVVAQQVFAKWLYPQDFADLDPAATWREFHERFSPIPLTGVFWAQLQ